jgi:hypothetical protein
VSTTTPLPPAPAAPPAATPPTGGASRVVAILTIALGCAVVLGVIGSAVFSTIGAASVRTETQTVDASGVTDLNVTVDAASLQIEFADVSDATLEVTSGLGVGAWTLEREGDELTVATPRRFGPGWIFGGEVRATLTLPSELEGTTLDAALDLSAGELVVGGAFGALDVEVGAGALSVEGSARTLTVDLSAGGADVELDGVAEADFSVSAGAVDARLTGAAPRLVTVDVSAGSLDLTLPDAAYDVRSDVSAGEFDNRLSTEVGARNVVDVTVSAGSVTIAEAR